MFRHRFRSLLSGLRLIRGKLKLSKWNRVENRCQQCGGYISKGRLYICSVGCQNDYVKRIKK